MNTPIPVIDPVSNRNGKIARLPRSLRDRINQSLYDRCTARRLLRALNQLPEVKAVLAAHFDGRPLNAQNITEWKQGGYRDWLHHREILEQHRELTADAADLAATAQNMADSLFGLLTLDYAQLLMHRDGQSPEDFEKKRKALSVTAQDIVRVHRSHLNARRVQVAESRLQRDQEKTTEEVFERFTEWANKAEVRKTCILEPLEQMRRMRERFRMPAAPEDPFVKMEFEKQSKSGHFFKNQTEIKPNQTEKMSDETPPAVDPLPAEGTSVSNDQVHRPTASPSPGGEGRDEGELKTNFNGQDEGELEGDSLAMPLEVYEAGEPKSSILNYAGKLKSELIAEIEAECARPKPVPAQKTPASSPIPKPSAPQPPKPVLSAYDRALLAGKTHLEALYIHQSAPNPPKPLLPPGASPLDAFSEPADTPPRVLPLHSYNPYGPAPSVWGWQGPRPLDPNKTCTG